MHDSPRVHSEHHLQIMPKSRTIITTRTCLSGFLAKFSNGTLVLSGAFAMAEPVVSGITSSELDPALKGHVLIEELNCAACHSTDKAMAARSKRAPLLADVGSRVNPEYLEAFIRAPHATKPGTTMPDLLGAMDEDGRKEAATSLTHFLLSLKKNDFSPQAPDAVAAKLGKGLFHSQGCSACHSPRDEKGTELLAENSVPLGALDEKYSFKSLVAFLRDPHASRPSGRMPDMKLQDKDIERIAHFLLQDTQVPGHLAYTLYRGNIWEGLESETVTAERAGHVDDFDLKHLGDIGRHVAIRYDGWLNVPIRGSHDFFLKMNGGSLVVNGKTIVDQEPSDRRGVMQLEGKADLEAGWQPIQLTYFHTGREAAFTIEMAGPEFERKTIPSSMLSVSKDEIPAFIPLAADPALAARGRQHFETLGCASCHDDLKVVSKSAQPFAKLDPARGCLSENPAASPNYHLTNEQRGFIAAALPQVEKPEFSDQQRLDKTLVSLNCIACHDRGGLGGVTPERNAYFTGTQLALGDQGRIPPPLSHVGAKLTPEWIEGVLLHGKRQRPYLNASMPQYGEANVAHLVELFGKVDELEKAVIPKIANLQESKNAGYEMIGINGLGCIACHEFNGQKSGDIAALDIAHVTDRLQKNWFTLFMQQPSRFHPTVIMPSYWPGGQTTRPNILGGDSAQQIEALWAYLEDGTRAKKPMGLSRQSNEVRVGDVTEICRGRSPAGYRGIAVGHVEGIHLAFDSEEMALRQLWKGEFVNINFGSFQPRGTDRISFPPGIPFHRLKSMEENWPYKGKTNYLFPQDHGYQFRGYHLDDARRPTFLYRYGTIAVEDHFEDLRDKDGAPYFKRTLRFETPGTQQLFHFRAATGTTTNKKADNDFEIDSLRLRITSDHKGIVREGNPDEILIPLTLPKGSSTLTLEYQW